MSWREWIRTWITLTYNTVHYQLISLCKKLVFLHTALKQIYLSYSKQIYIWIYNDWMEGILLIFNLKHKKSRNIALTSLLGSFCRWKVCWVFLQRYKTSLLSLGRKYLCSTMSKEETPRYVAVHKRLCTNRCVMGQHKGLKKGRPWDPKRSCSFFYQAPFFSQGRLICARIGCLEGKWSIFLLFNLWSLPGMLWDYI